MMRAIRLCRRANATRRWAPSRVTSATAPVANDADEAVTVRPMIAPKATGDREVERAELGERTPLSKPQAGDGHREHQDRLDRDPAETIGPADQFQQPFHLPAKELADCGGDLLDVGL